MVEFAREELREVLQVFAESGIRELRLELDGIVLHVSKDALDRAAGGGAAPAEARPSTARVGPTGRPATGTGTQDRAEGSEPGGTAATGGIEGLLAVRAPTLGTFYRRPRPEQAPYVEVGDLVSPTTVVGTIEVMKMYTEVVAGVSGRVARIAAENQQMVEYDEPVMYVEPEDESS